MNTENWKKVKELVPEVLELQTAERVRFLEDSGVDVEIRREVESLVGFEKEAENLMQMSAVEFSKDFFDEDDAAKNALIGQNFGVYKIVREIGWGGMGAVYLAKRNDGKFEQTVALKLLRREMNTAALRRRFRQEREILASLTHPNIARLLDAGTTDDKIPFLAMEYVEGLPIDEYCGRHNLDLNERLNLFRRVCAAVDFAHRNLIVHRDLKPSNILVIDEGIPKLLDFGISKILSMDVENENAATITRFGMMTPAYASPEQLQKKSVTTATDIYSLGVILYELLSGHRPFEKKEDDIKEIYQAVLETDPPLPSSLAEGDSKSSVQSSSPLISEANTRISANFSRSENGGNPKDEENPSAVFEMPTVVNDANPQTAPPRQSQTAPHPNHVKPQYLRGDLDNIILKALKKEPERRYSSAENFADDIKRHLDGLPVAARPDTFSYRAEKFIKRNIFSVVAGTLILLAIVVGVTATLWQARIARAERARAEKRFNDVRALANSFLFEVTPQIENLPGSTPAREIVVKRALEYLDSLSEETGDDADLQRELAAAYEKVGDVQGNPGNPNLGDTKGALESYEKALVIRERLLSANADDLKTQNNLANTYKNLAEIYRYGEEPEKTDIFIDKSLALQEKILARQPDDFEVRRKYAATLHAKGIQYFNANDYQKSIEYFNRAREINEKLSAERPADPKIAEQNAFLFVSLGESQNWDNDMDDSEKNLQKGLAMLIRLDAQNPNDHNIQRSLMLAYAKTAAYYQDTEDYPKSIDFYRKDLATAQKIIAADPLSFQAKQDEAVAHKRLAEALDYGGKSRESVENLKLALGKFQELAAADPNNTEAPYFIANTRFALGETYLSLKDYAAALEQFLAARDEFAGYLASKPADGVTKRIAAFNLTRLGISYAALAEKENRRANLQNASENFRAGLDNLYQLKSEGKLGKIDDEEISSVEKQFEKVKGLM